MRSEFSDLLGGACLSHLSPVRLLSPNLHFAHMETLAALQMYQGPSDFWPSLFPGCLPEWLLLVFQLFTSS